jgi:hypothetical protein
VRTDIVVPSVLNAGEVRRVGSRAASGDLVERQHGAGYTCAAICRGHTTCAYSVVSFWGGIRAKTYLDGRCEASALIDGIGSNQAGCAGSVQRAKVEGREPARGWGNCRVAAEMGTGNRMYLQAGDVVRVRLPYSEVCIHMQVAGKPMNVQLLYEGRSPMAQLFKDDGSRFSFPILLGEAGIYTDDAGHHYLPARALVTPKVELDSL